MIRYFYLLFAFIAVSEVAVSAEGDTIRIIHVTDPHVCNLTGYKPFFVEKRLHFGENIVTFPEFLKTVPLKNHADVLTVTGDNVDFYEAETEKGNVLDTQVEQFSRLLDFCKIPVYLTLGNHDIASYRVDSGPSVGSSQVDCERARASWMRNVACFKEGTYYSQLLRIDTVTIRLIFLDNSYYSTAEITDNVTPFTIDPFQLRWLDAQLNASSSDIEIIFMHMPLPYENAVNNKIPAVAMKDYLAKIKSFNLMQVLDKNSSTRLIFAGHKHINSVNSYTMSGGNKLTQVLTAAFGYDTNNWRMIKITKNNILVSFPGNTRTEQIIPVR